MIFEKNQLMIAATTNINPTGLYPDFYIAFNQ
jgi:hypothetical protein